LRFAFDCLDGEPSPRRVPINALLSGDVENIDQRALELSRSSCSTVKLKVGRAATFAADVSAVRQVRSVLRAEQKLRLDANRAWTFSSAKAFLQAIADCDIEYIEEPLRDPGDLEALYADTHVPFALDETVGDHSTFDAFPNAAALIVKPTLIGGRERLRELARHGHPIVLSAAYESGVGISRIAQLAAEFSPGIPAGLDTYSWLAQDVLQERLKIEDWHLVIPDELVVDRSCLEELKL
jgi:O-succinylbenzoate synthase